MITKSQKEALINVAKESLKSEYALKNKGNYSAAVLTSQGNIYSGVSYYSDTYSLTLHGEQAALAHAAAHGEGEIIAIAVASQEVKSSGEFTNPCHMCKQLLYECSKRNNLPILIILSNNLNEVKEVQLEDMISYPWPG
jgi:cytidine deaminase